MILSRLVPEGYLPPSEAEKIDFSSIWLNWNSNIQPNVPVKKGSEIYHHRLNLSSNQLINQEDVITWASALGEFSGQPLMLGLDFHLISIYCLHHALYKIHTWKLFVYGKIFARGKIKIGRKSSGKKEKKTGPKKKERVPFCQEKKKNPLLKWLGELHAGVQISNKEVAAKPKFAIHEGSLLCRPPQRFPERSRKKKGGLNGLLFPRNHYHRHWRQEVSLSY